MKKDSNYEGYSALSKVISWVGNRFNHLFIGQLLVLFTGAVISFGKTFFRNKASRQQIFNQVYFTGFEALPLIALVSVITGGIVVLQAITVMPSVGYGGFFGNILVIVIVRELGPIMTAFLVAGRTGAALSTYVANMRVHSEIDALESLGVKPVRYLVMPALVGGVISLIGLTMFFNIFAIVAGFLLTKSIVMIWSLGVNLDWLLFREAIFNAMSVTDLAMMIVKPVAFGSIIATVACYYGLKVKNDIREVPQAASRSVVSSFSLIVISNLLLSSFYISSYLRQIQNIM